MRLSKLRLMTAFAALLLVTANALCADPTTTSRPATTKPAPPPPPAPPPTIADVRADFEAKRYPDCLKKAARVLNGPNLSPADKFELLNIKADCLLQQKDSLGASDLFVAASKVTKDKVESAVMIASSTVVKRSQNLQFTPKTGDKKPISILEKDQRKTAINALYQDSLDPVETAYKAATEKSELAPIARAATAVRTLMPLELAATADNVKCNEMSKGLREHAKSTVKSALEEIDQNVNQIAADAARIVETVTYLGAERHVKGLSGDETTKLQGYSVTCERIAQAIKELKTALEADNELFHEEMVKDDALHRRIPLILAGHYDAR